MIVKLGNWQVSSGGSECKAHSSSISDFTTSAPGNGNSLLILREATVTMGIISPCADSSYILEMTCCERETGCLGLALSLTSKFTLSVELSVGFFFKPL